MKFFRNHHERLARLEREAAEAEHQRAHVESKWPEVRAAAEWAKDIRERNHLADLFIASLGGKS